jgi:hypothetical protein
LRIHADSAELIAKVLARLERTVLQHQLQRPPRAQAPPASRSLRETGAR